MTKIAQLAAVLIFLSSYPGAAQEFKTDEIRCKLDPACPKPGVRGFPFGDRGIQIKGGVADPPNSINFHINFAFDSSDLQNDSLITLQALGRALTDHSLSSYHFLITGFTDAKGTPEYNQGLSQRRATAVADYLASEYHVDRSRLEVKGLGMEQLFDPDRPYDEVNRRVQIVNLDGSSNAAP